LFTTLRKASRRQAFLKVELVVGILCLVGVTMMTAVNQVEAHRGVPDDRRTEDRPDHSAYPLALCKVEVKALVPDVSDHIEPEPSNHAQERYRRDDHAGGQTSFDEDKV
jgi:hypothetical protein